MHLEMLIIFFTEVAKVHYFSSAEIQLSIKRNMQG